MKNNRSAVASRRASTPKPGLSAGDSFDLLDSLESSLQAGNVKEALALVAEAKATVVVEMMR